MLFLLSNCGDDDDNNTNQNPTLPAITTEGLNTFGALVDGQVFIPARPPFSSNSILSASYQCFINPLVPERDSCFLLIDANNRLEVEILKSIAIRTIDKKVVEGDTLVLEQQEGEDIANASYNFLEVSSPDIIYNTTNVQTGELRILRFDYENRILSGTFWFDAVNDEGEIVEVRDGRFDVTFTI